MQSSAALQQMLSLNAYAGMRMTPAELAAQYREYAARCFHLAQRQETAGEKLALIDIAHAWSSLAEQAERNEALVVVYQTPEPKSSEGQT